MNENFYRLFAEEVYPNISLNESIDSKDIILAKYISYFVPAKIITKTEISSTIQFGNNLFGQIPNDQFSIYPIYNDFTNVGDIINVKITDFSPTYTIASRKSVQEESLKFLNNYLEFTVIGTVKEVNETFIWADIGNGILCKILNNDLFFYTGYQISFIKQAFLIGEKIPIFIKYFSKKDKYFIGSYRDAFSPYEMQKSLFKAGQVLTCIITGETNDSNPGYFVLINPYVKGIVDIPENYEYASAIHRETRISAYVKRIGKKGLHLNIITPYDIRDRS